MAYRHSPPPPHKPPNPPPHPPPAAAKASLIWQPLGLPLVSLPIYGTLAQQLYSLCVSVEAMMYLLEL